MLNGFSGSQCHPAGQPSVSWLLCPLLLFSLISLVACQAISPEGDTAVVTPPVQADLTLPANTPRFVVDSEASEIRLLVYRSGPLARFGHNHVITGSVRGEIRAGDTTAASGFRLEIPIESFIVDPRAARAEEGEEFVAEVSEEARQATRANLLGKNVLDAATQPVIRIDSIALRGPRWNPSVMARATLHGATRDIRFPAAVFQQGDVLNVIARFLIHQSDFGLVPLSVLGGGLQVRDAIDIRIRLVARQAT